MPPHASPCGLHSPSHASPPHPARPAHTQRYKGFDGSGIGAKFAKGKASLEEMAAAAAKGKEPELRSGKQERLESVFNAYAYGPV